MSEQLSAEHVGGCNPACGRDGHFLHGADPDIVLIDGLSYHPGSEGYALALALIHARSERDELTARAASRDARLAAAEALADEWERTGERLQGIPAAQTWLLTSARLRAALHPDPSEAGA